MKPGTLLVVLTALICLSITFLFVNRGAGAENPRDGVYWDEDTARFVRREVATSYVDELDDAQKRAAFYRAMDAFVDLDPYSEFIPPREHKEWREDIEGKYAGLGVQIELVPEGLELVGVLPGGPAATAGLAVGDTLVRADGTSLAGMVIEDVTKHLKGPADTPVRIAYLPGPRPEDGPPAGPEKEVVVTRGVVSPPTVFVRRVGASGEFGVVRLTDFAEETADDFDKAIDSLIADGVKGLVLDLRRNGGGVLGVAVKVTDRFLRSGVIVRMEGRGIDATKIHRARDEKGDVPDLPLIVLVDGGSASASEVVAGALQDHRRALLVGDRTYGKFLVQQIKEIPGTQAALKLTTSRYYTPSGRSYQGPPRPNGVLAGPDDPTAEPAGLFPDASVKLTKEERDTFLKASANQEGRVWGQETRFPEVPADYTDPQLQRALDLLTGDIALRKIKRR